MSSFAAHQDNKAVDGFAVAMKAKMAASRAKGRSGWQACPASVLWGMLREHVEKGDPLDVACLAMMIAHVDPVTYPNVSDLAKSEEDDFAERREEIDHPQPCLRGGRVFG